METSWVSVLLVMVLLALTYCVRNPLAPTRPQPSKPTPGESGSRRGRTLTPEAGRSTIPGLRHRSLPGVFLEPETRSERFHLDE